MITLTEETSQAARKRTEMLQPGRVQGFIAKVMIHKFPTKQKQQRTHRSTGVGQVKGAGADSGWERGLVYTGWGWGDWGRR